MPADIFNASPDEAHALAEAAKNSRPTDPQNGFRPHAILSTRQEVTIRDGTMTHTTVDKSFGVPTAWAVHQTRAGFIEVPGMGETPIEAAKAAGLIPTGWKEGDPLPFDHPADARKVDAGTPTPKVAQDHPDDAGDDTLEAHRIKVANGVIEKATAVHGGDIVMAAFDAVAESGEMPETGLPAGVTETMAQQVLAGYVAQANGALAASGASVALLQNVLTDDELRTARRVTIAGMNGDLEHLGRVAVERLAKVPEEDPEGFADMIAGMNPKERKALRQDLRSGEWRVNVPGHPEMSFGAAVRMGIVRV